MGLIEKCGTNRESVTLQDKLNGKAGGDVGASAGGSGSSTGLHAAAMDLAPSSLSFQGLGQDDSLGGYGDPGSASGAVASPLFKFGNPSPMKREFEQWNLGSSGLTPTAATLSSGFTPTAVL
eukprot:SAG31_NODE_4855_length_2904_cov_1.413547_3_plen_122_part_00